MNHEGKPDCNFEYRTVNLDSIHATSSTGSQSTLGGMANNFVTFLPSPIQDIVEVKVVAASLTQDTTQATLTSNIAYMVVDELTSQFNQQSGTQSTPAQNSFGGVQTVPSGAAIAKFQLDNTSTGRQHYKGNDYPIVTQYIAPINRLDRMSVRLIGEDGTTPVPLVPPFFCTLTFTTMRRNLCTRL